MHVYNCFSYCPLFRFGIFPRHRVSLLSTFWAQEQRQAAFSTEAQILATHSGDSKSVLPAASFLLSLDLSTVCTMRDITFFLHRHRQSTRQRWASSRRRQENTSSTVWMIWCRYEWKCVVGCQLFCVVFYKHWPPAGEHDHPGGHRHPGREGRQTGVHWPAKEDAYSRCRQEDHTHEDAEPSFRYHDAPSAFPPQLTVRQLSLDTTNTKLADSFCLMVMIYFLFIYKREVLFPKYGHMQTQMQRIWEREEHVCQQQHSKRSRQPHRHI